VAIIRGWRGERMRRRSVLLFGLVALFLTPQRTNGQPASAKIPRVGFLTAEDSAETATDDAFRAGLRDLGYVEGRDIITEFRVGHGDYTLVKRLAAELVNIPVDVIVTAGGPVAGIALEATNKIPIVTTGVHPLLMVLIGSLARPNVNVTGFTFMAPELAAKRLEILKTAFPEISAVAVFYNPTNSSMGPYWRITEEAARALGLQVTKVEAASTEALLALRPIVFAGLNAVLVIPDPIFWNRRRDIVALVNAARLPAIYPEREYADYGGLIAYGANTPDNFRRAAGYVDRILKGAKPGDLPIQEPVKFDFIVNLKTANALGLTIPPAILARADEVIE
jgi:putative tryptophan/tyrosine transport system substrate-binding protein